MFLQNMMMLGSVAKLRLRELFSEEKGEVNIVAIVVLIGIAVLLALIFKDQIANLLSTLFNTITENANSAVGGS
ncbi:MAG: flagellin-like protein [Clostridiales bacterium]|nr:flagellin-like protein [Clostridiales bacterium]